MMLRSADGGVLISMDIAKEFNGAGYAVFEAASIDAAMLMLEAHRKIGL
jgi:hypothetical protein